MNKKSLYDPLKEKSDNMFTITGVNSLLELLDKLTHQIEEQEQTIDELRTENKFLTLKTNSQKNLIKRIDAENTELSEDVTIANNDYKKCYDEIIRLSEENNKQKMTINELQGACVDTRIELKKANNAKINLIKHIKQLNRANYQMNNQLGKLNDGFNNLTDLLAKRTAENAELDKENKVLKLKIKMMTKNRLNHIYGTAIYTDTDSIKETKDNDDNY